MTYTRHYIGTREECEAQARAHCIEWLGGEERYQKLCNDLREDLQKVDTSTAHHYKLLRMYIPFAGIAGYWPIRAMARDILDCSHACTNLHGICSRCEIK